MTTRVTRSQAKKLLDEKIVKPKSPVSPRKTPLSPRNTPVSPRKTPVSPKKTPVSSRNTPVSPKNAPVSPKKTPVSPKNLSDLMSNLKLSPNKIPSIKRNFWTIPNIEDINKNNLNIFKKNKSKICESPGIIEEIPNFVDNNDIESLKDKKLITSAIINMYIDYIHKNSSNKKDFIILNSELYYAFVNAVENGENLEGFNEGYLSNLKGTLENKKIIIPINLNNEHWIFAMIVPKEKSIYILDPYGDINEEVFEYLQFLWTVQKYKPDIKFKPIYNIPKLPKQLPRDITSCGAFTSMFVSYLINTGTFPTKEDFNTLKDISNIRKYILDIIINKICKFTGGKNHKK